MLRAAVLPMDLDDRRSSGLRRFRRCAGVGCVGGARINVDVSGSGSVIARHRRLAPLREVRTVRFSTVGDAGEGRLTVDGVVAVGFDDDGVTHGSVWTHPGWIGSRQMGHTVRCRYDDLRIQSLRKIRGITP